MKTKKNILIFCSIFFVAFSFVSNPKAIRNAEVRPFLESGDIDLKNGKGKDIVIKYLNERIEKCIYLQKKYSDAIATQKQNNVSYEKSLQSYNFFIDTECYFVEALKYVQDPETNKKPCYSRIIKSPCANLTRRILLTGLDYV